MSFFKIWNSAFPFLTRHLLPPLYKYTLISLSLPSLPLQKQIQISPVVCLRDSQFFLPHNTKCDAADSDSHTVRNSLSHNLSTFASLESTLLRVFGLTFVTTVLDSSHPLAQFHNDTRTNGLSVIKLVSWFSLMCGWVSQINTTSW